MMRAKVNFSAHDDGQLASLASKLAWRELRTKRLRNEPPQLRWSSSVVGGRRRIRKAGERKHEREFSAELGQPLEGRRPTSWRDSMEEEFRSRARSITRDSRSSLVNQKNQIGQPAGRSCVAGCCLMHAKCKHAARAMGGRQAGGAKLISVGRNQFARASHLTSLSRPSLAALIAPICGRFSRPPPFPERQSWALFVLA